MWAAGGSGRRNREAARHREQLLRTAATVIAERGIDHTRFANVAAATGMAISSLQYIFGSRDDILIAAVELAWREERARLEEGISEHTEPRDRLARLLSLTMGETAETAQTRLLWLEVRHAALRQQQLRSLYSERQEVRLALIRQAIEQGVETGPFPASTEVDEAAIQVLALVDGLGVPEAGESGLLDLPASRRLAVEACSALLKVRLPLP
ncbi:MAG: TetR/AcrR family transcriptional regulator [Chloroflexota bacterium]